MEGQDNITGTPFNFVIKMCCIADVTVGYYTDPNVYYQSSSHRAVSERFMPKNEYNLPLLRGIGYGINHLGLPVEFSWINYWNSKYIELMGIKPDDEKLFFRFEKLSNGSAIFPINRSATRY